MRKLSWIDYTDVDLQHCLHELSEGGGLAKFGITNEADIVSIRHETRDDGKGGLECTVWVYYWSENPKF